jgi:hypothetical protein
MIQNVAKKLICFCAETTVISHFVNFLLVIRCFPPYLEKKNTYHEDSLHRNLPASGVRDWTTRNKFGHD